MTRFAPGRRRGYLDLLISASAFDQRLTRFAPGRRRGYVDLLISASARHDSAGACVGVVFVGQVLVKYWSNKLVNQTGQP